MGHTSAEIHSNRSLGQRKEALEGFKSGKYRVLVATDIAARGIDVKGIELVINYDLPSTPEDYVHRIGRTARAGAEGHAISFALPEEKNDIRAIERLIRKSIPVQAHGELPPDREAYATPRDSSFSSRTPKKGFHKHAGSFQKHGRNFDRRKGRNFHSSSGRPENPYRFLG